MSIEYQSCVGYRSCVLIEQVSPMAMTTSVIAITLRGAAGGGDFTVRHDYSMKRTEEHWELGTWFRRWTISSFFSFKMYHCQSSTFQLSNGINRRKFSPARAKDESTAPIVPQSQNNKNLHTAFLFLRVLHFSLPTFH